MASFEGLCRADSPDLGLAKLELTDSSVSAPYLNLAIPSVWDCLTGIDTSLWPDANWVDRDVNVSYADGRDVTPLYIAFNEVKKRGSDSHLLQ